MQCYHETIQAMNSILWNGPLGIFEWQSAQQGTRLLAEAITASKAHCVAGGGDTLAAIKFLKQKIVLSIYQQVVVLFYNWLKIKLCSCGCVVK